MTTAIGRKSDSDFASHILGNMLNMDEYGLFERFGIFLVKSAVRNKCNSASNTTSGEWCVGGQRATLHRVPKFHVKHRNFYDRKEMWGKRYFFCSKYIHGKRWFKCRSFWGRNCWADTRVGQKCFLICKFIVLRKLGDVTQAETQQGCDKGKIEQAR